MTELFEEEQEQEQLNSADDEVIDVELDQEIPDTPWSIEDKTDLSSGARRRLEDLLDERKLREELDDYFELEQF